MKKIEIYKFEILTLLIIILISFYRSPFIFLNGRFIGEEASHHFLHALNNGFINNLIYFDNTSGYYNIIPNILSEFSTYLPLELAPMTTVYGSFLVIINLSFICLFKESYFLDTKKKKFFASFLLFISPPFVPEIWVNSLNSQIYLCLTAILILFIKNKKKEHNYYIYLNIFLASLSGIYTCILTPFFFARYLYSKTKYNLINFVIIFLSTLLQLSIIFYSKLSNTLVESKFSISLNYENLVLFIYNNLSKPVFGRQLTHLIYEKINLLILLLLLTFAFVFLIFNFFKKDTLQRFKKDFILQSLIISFFLYSTVIVIGSIDSQLGGRYAVIPGSIFLLIIFRLITFFQSNFIKYLLGFFLLSSIITGIYEFRPPTENVRNQYIKFLDCINCPIWKDEVKKWKKDENYLIKLWPYPKKEFKLKITKN